MALHEPGRSTSEIGTPNAAAVVSPGLSNETVDEQILDAVDTMEPVRVADKERGREKEDKMKEKEDKKKHEQKAKDKRVSEHKHSSSIVRHTGGDTMDQDAHEWLLEHYASASPSLQPAPAPASSDKGVAGSSVAAPQAHTSRGTKAEGGNIGLHHADEPVAAHPSKPTKKARSRTPTPLAMLEEELDSVLPASNTVAPSFEDDLGLDLASPVTASPIGVVVDDNEMDVDNELLSLVDDVPPVQHTPRPKPTAIPKFDARTKSLQPGNERGSMAPPTLPVKDVGKAHPAKAADSGSSSATSAVAGHKKKDVSHKVGLRLLYKLNAHIIAVFSLFRSRKLLRSQR